MNYPKIMKSLGDGSMVIFTDLQTGTYLISNVGKDYYKTGTTHDDFVPCTDTETWIEYLDKEEIHSLSDKDISRIRGNGGATSYYDLPIGATDLGHLIKHKKMEHGIGEAFSALYRLNNNGEYRRNLVKVIYYIQKELEYFDNQNKEK